MGFRINTNVNAIDTQRNLMATSTEMSITMRRLSSGLRINSAADDAAGLAIGQKLNAQVNGLNQAVRNAQDGISLVQTAEGALNETQSILQRMRQLAVQSANDTNTQTDRTAIQSEMNQLATELSRISNTTSFNTKNLLAGGFSGQTLQIGANLGENMSFSISAMDAASLGVAANGAAVSTTQNTANITTISNVGKGYNNGISYTINAKSITAGSLTDANGTSAKGKAQGQNIGNETMNLAGTYAGTAAANYTVRVSATDGGKNVTQIQYSTDGGSTWATANGQIQTDGSYNFNVNQSSASPTSPDSGLTLNFTVPSSGPINPSVGDQFTFSTVGATTSATSSTSLIGTVNDTVGGTGADAAFTGYTADGTYTGPISGALQLTVAVGAMGAVTGVTAQIGSTSYAAAAGPTNNPVNYTYTSGAAGAAKLSVNVFGLNINMNNTGAFATNGNNHTITFTGTLNPLSTSTNSSITGGGNDTAGVVDMGLIPAGGSNTAVSAITKTTANVTGQYTGANGTLTLLNNGGWTAPTATFTNTSLVSSAATLTGVSYTAAAGSAQSKLQFTYSGATYTVYNVSNTTNGNLSIALANNASSPGGDIGVTTTTNSGATTNVTQGQNVGNETLNTAGAFLGSATTNYLTQVTATSGNLVTGVKFSTDGGNTWASATAVQQADGSYKFQVQRSSAGGTNGSGGDSGLFLSFTQPTNMIAPQVGDQFSFQAVAGSNFSAAATTITKVTGGTYTASATAPTATVTGTYTGSYTGAISINTNFNGANSTWAPSAGTTVTIGNTTLDASQIQYNTTSNTLSFLGLTYTITNGSGGGGATGQALITGQTVTAASNAMSANLAGTADVTTGNTTSSTAPTVTASATQLGSGAPGLGAGSILLKLNNYGSGGTPIGINNVAWQKAGAAGAASFMTNDFSYNAVSGFDVYTSGASYGNSITVTGADTNQYKIAVSNATSAGATVTITNTAGTTTYATYNVATSGASVNDIVALNLNQPNIQNTATTNIGAESAAVSGTYTGASNLQYTAKVAQIDTNGNATQIQLSTDGGKTFGTAITANGYTGSAFASGTATSFNLNNGLTLTMTPGQSNQNKAAVGDTFNFVAMATSANGGTGSDLLQLQNGGTNIGTAQLLQNNQTSATLGAVNMTLTANFNAIGTAGGVTAGSTTITSQASSAAVIGANDTVVSNSTAYAGLDVTTQANAQAAISTIDAAINTVSLQRAQLGAIQNRLQHTINNLSVGSENLNAAQSRIMDVDVAAETVNLTKDQILEQAGISVLAQANQQPQMVLKLLQ